MTGPARKPEPSLDDLFAEYMRRVDQGGCDRRQFLEEHPEHAADLAELLDIEDSVLELAGPIVDSNDLDPLDSTQPLPTVNEGETVALPLSDSDRAPSDKSAQRGEAMAESDDPQAGEEETLEVAIPFGNYQLIEILGRGGMGVVYRARQNGLDREVAVKMILNSHLASSEDVDRFYTEARAAAGIRHNHVVDIYEIGEVESQHFFSMELIEGSDLAELLREGRIESRRAARLLKDVAEAVHQAHEQGVLHRDLKPANILIDDGDRVVVTDFGLAHELSTKDQERLTATGLAMGTPSYMSPEQAGGKREKMGPASDVFSLGAVLYAMLTGNSPHRGETVMETLIAVLHHPASHPATANPQADPVLCRICLKCLSKEPSERYPSAQALADDLQRFLDGRPVMAQDLPLPMRMLRWLGQVPVLAALSGRVSHRPTSAQLKFQAGLVLTLIGAMIWFVSYPRIQQAIEARMPADVVLAGGQPDGMYSHFLQTLSDQLNNATNSTWRVQDTVGSGENRQSLLRGDAGLALLQESMVGSDQLAVVAPVFEEFVYVFVRGEIATWEELSGARVAIGPQESGMAATAEVVLKGVGVQRVHQAPAALGDDPSLDGAIATIGQGSSLVKRLLARDDLRLLPLPPHVTQRLTADPRYRTVRVTGRQAEAVVTVSTPAFLACRRDAPAPLVRAALENLYPVVTNYQIDRAAASHWDFMPLHPEARRYFREQPD